MKSRKKLTVNTLAYGNIKQRKKQYAILLSSIVLAMVFSSSILFFMFSAAETYRESSRKEIGDQDAIVYVSGFEESDYQAAVRDHILTDYGFAHTIGYAYAKDGEEKFGANIAWLDDKAKELSYQIFLEGTYPQKENEIAVEKKILSRLGYSDAQIGDTITVNLKVQNDYDYGDIVEKEYTLAGIVSDKMVNIKNSSYASDLSNMSNGMETLVPALFVAQGTKTEAGGKEKLTAYVTTIQDKDEIKKKYPDLDNYDLSPYTLLVDYLEGLGSQVSFYEINDQHAVSGYAFLNFSSLSEDSEYIVILAAVLTFASCIAIVNAFNTNLKERKKQIGLLRAVGATKRQIVNIFGREALLISLIAAPVSIAVSYGIVSLLLKILSDEAIMTKSLAVLPVAAAADILVVMLAALVPLASASRITPMQAIRNISNNRKVKTKKIKSKRQFAAAPHIAKRSLIFYKSSRAAVSVFLMITIAFSCLGFSYMAYIKEDLYSFGYDYLLDNPSLALWGEESLNSEWTLDCMTETDRQEIEALPYHLDVYGFKKIAVTIQLEALTDYFKTIESNWFIVENPNSVEKLQAAFDKEPADESYEEAKKQLGIEKEMLITTMDACDTDLIRQLESHLIDGEIDYDKLASGEEVILVAAQKIQLLAKINRYGGTTMITVSDSEIGQHKNFSVISEGECPYKAGDQLTVTIAAGDSDGNVISKTEKEVTVGAIVSPDDSDFLCSTGPCCLLTSLQGLNTFYSGAKYGKIAVNAAEEIDETTDSEISEALQVYADKYDAWLSSNYESIQSQKNDILSLYTAMIAVIIIGFAICASIINNAISAQIRESKRMIGTLRAVGASETDLVQTYLRQMLFMFTWGVAAGYGIFLAAYFILKIITTYYLGNDTPLVFAPWATIGMTVLTFLVCLLNLWSKIRRERKNSIVENIREL